MTTPPPHRPVADPYAAAPGAPLSGAYPQSPPVHAAAARPLELIVFFGGANWPLWVAADKGYFAAQGLEVNVTSTPAVSVNTWS